MILPVRGATDAASDAGVMSGRPDFGTWHRVNKMTKGCIINVVANFPPFQNFLGVKNATAVATKHGVTTLDKSLAVKGLILYKKNIYITWNCKFIVHSYLKPL